MAACAGDFNWALEPQGMVSDGIPLLKVDGDYWTWSRLMKWNLVLNGVWEIVESKPENLQEIENNIFWRQRHHLALALIRRSLNPTIRGLVEDVDEAWEVWGKVRSMFSESTLLVVRKAWETLVSTQYVGGESTLISHLGEFDRAFKELSDKGQVFTDMWKVQIFVDSLPKKYRQQITILRIAEENISWERVVQTLMSLTSAEKNTT